MDKIPPEILITVFKYLHLKQKFECMLVCRSWAQILVANSCLSETITILSLPFSQSLNQRVNELARRSHIDPNPAGSKCKRLVLENKSGSIFADKTVLATTFPSLEFFFLESIGIGNHTANEEHDNPSVVPSKQLDIFQGWRNNLKTLIDWSYGSVLFFDLIGSGVFDQLTTLSFVYMPFHLSKSEIFKRLKNVPFLTTLDINIDNPSVLDFEALHSNTPRLTSLCLGGFLVFDTDQVKSLAIEPAKQLKTFKVLANFRLGDPEGFLLYMSKKYIHLNELDLSSNSDIVMPSPINQTLPTNTTLAWNNLLSNIGPSLIKCKIGYNEMLEGMFDKLLEHAFNLKGLSIECKNYNTLCKYDFAHPLFQCLQTLSVLDISSTIKLSKLRELKGLRELNLTGTRYSKGRPIMLNKFILDLPKNIETLGMSCIRLTADSKRVEYDQQSNLVHLKFTKVKFDTCAVKFIESHFEMLKSLSLVYCPGIAEMELPNHYLTFVEIIPHSQVMSVSSCDDDSRAQYTKENTHLQLITSNQTNYYKAPILEGTRIKKLNLPLLDIHDRAIQHTLKPSPFDEDLKYFQFKCINVQSFYFCDFLIL